MRDDERRQQHEQGERQELLVDVPEEEEQVGEEDGGGQAANVQEVHAKQKEGGRESNRLRAYLSRGRTVWKIGSYEPKWATSASSEAKR